MKYQRTSHAVNELKYYLVWVPKYQKVVLSEPVSRDSGLMDRACDRAGMRFLVEPMTAATVAGFASARAV